MTSAMISTRSQILRCLAGTAALGAALAGFCATATPAAARVWIGFGFPFYVGPPAYYPPPVYYPPPPVYYAPPPPAYSAPAYSAPAYSAPAYSAPPPASADAAPAAAGQSCYAGAYVCPMDHPVPSGANCYCPGNGGYRIWGHAS